MENLIVNLGKNEKGEVVDFDFEKLPGLLIVGSSGSGKTIIENNIISQLIKNNTNNDIEFALVDPKMIDFRLYENSKYLYKEIFHCIDNENNIFDDLIDEMNLRYNHFDESKVDNIYDYNKKHKDNPNEILPFIFLVIDEFMDVFYDKDYLNKTMSLVAKGRACGIRCVLSSQRALDKDEFKMFLSNMPIRICLKIFSKKESKLILGNTDAYNLTNCGEGYFVDPSKKNTQKVHFDYISVKDIQNNLKAKSND